MTRVAVIDHGAGNLVSIGQGLAAAGATVTIAEKPAELAGAAGIVLPGVGATAAAMRRLDEAGFVPALRENDRPLLGICVGMQVLFEESEEDGAACLGILAGRVELLAAAPRLPHIGWNDLRVTRPDLLLRGLEDEPFYFVHSYAPVPVDPGVVLARAEYGTPFVAAVRAGRVAGVQFHPERSGPAGLAVLANFVDECREAADAA